MRRLLPLLLSVLLLAGCASPAAPEEEGAKRYEATFLTLFDTVTTVVGYAESEEDFQATAQSLHDALLEYHQLYDIYSDYDGVVNLKAVNDAAGGAPVVVDRKIIDLVALIGIYSLLPGPLRGHRRPGQCRLGGRAGPVA